jgi:hypothetical protein
MRRGTHSEYSTIEFCTKLNFLEGVYAITQNIGFLLSWVGTPCRYGGYTLRSLIEAPLITRKILPETHFLLVIMADDARARPFLQFQASC